MIIVVGAIGIIGVLSVIGSMNWKSLTGP